MSYGKSHRHMAGWGGFVIGLLVSLAIVASYGFRMVDKSEHADASTADLMKCEEWLRQGGATPADLAKFEEDMRQVSPADIARFGEFLRQQTPAELTRFVDN